MSFFTSLFGDESKKEVKRLEPLVFAIGALEPTIKTLSDEEFSQKTAELQDRLGAGATLDELLPEAFALVREAALRTLKQRHFDVQLMGGIVLHRGTIVEMKTGEGKTLVATLPAYLNALTGKGVHVVTVNDYLARRDGVWMGQVYTALGLSVGVINHDASYLYDPTHSTSVEDTQRDLLGSFKIFHEFLRPCTRREAYRADITYGTNNEFGFDYLRDNIEYSQADLRQRGHTYAIVDEIDSILIDEARTPLIISAPSTDSEKLYETFSRIANNLVPNQDYLVDEKLRAATLTDAGIEKAESLLNIGNIYTERGIKYVHHLETAVRAKALYRNDKDYVVRDGEVVIVDEFTGRLQPGRRWSEGLHQAIEAKEGVPIQKESRTYASITFQNYFRMYEKLSGMTGTAMTSKEEFQTVYGLNTIAIPPNRSLTRRDNDDLIFQTESGKFKAIARKVHELHEKGQPVLVGTASIEKNELLSEYLKKEGIPHEVLNAKNHEREGEIIAQAGVKGKVTIATNMAGRGVDIKLGGNPASEEQYEEVKALGGFFVLGTERHEARRIDNQLRGRSGRQGDPGETQFFVSLEDTLMRVFASETMKRMMGRFGIPEDEPIHNSIITRQLEAAQGKIEGFNFDARKHVLAFDDVLNHQRTAIYKRRRAILCGDDSEIDRTLLEISEGDEELGKTLADQKASLTPEQFYATVRRLMLQVIDMLWVEHLEAMDYMRGSVNLRAYGQRDPLVEYRKEGLRLFRELEASIDEHTTRLLPTLGAGTYAPKKEKLEEVHSEAHTLTNPHASFAEERGEKKLGRNATVTITNGTETRVLKYKKAQPLIQSGLWKLVS